MSELHSEERGLPENEAAVRAALEGRGGVIDGAGERRPGSPGNSTIANPAVDARLLAEQVAATGVSGRHAPLPIAPQDPADVLKSLQRFREHQAAKETDDQAMVKAALAAVGDLNSQLGEAADRLRAKKLKKKAKAARLAKALKDPRALEAYASGKAQKAAARHMADHPGDTAGALAAAYLGYKKTGGRQGWDDYRRAITGR